MFHASRTEPERKILQSGTSSLSHSKQASQISSQPVEPVGLLTVAYFQIWNPIIENILRWCAASSETKHYLDLIPEQNMAITERKFISVEQKARMMFVQLWKWPGMFHFYQWSNLRVPEPNEGCWLARGPSHNVLLARLRVIVLSSTPLTVSFTANGITQAICLPIWPSCLASLTVTLPVCDAGSLPGEPDQMSHGSKVTTTPTGASASPSNSAFLGRRGYSDFTAPPLFLLHLYIHLDPLGVVCPFHFPPFQLRVSL